MFKLRVWSVSFSLEMNQRCQATNRIPWHSMGLIYLRIHWNYPHPVTVTTRIIAFLVGNPELNLPLWLLLGGGWTERIHEWLSFMINVGEYMVNIPYDNIQESYVLYQSHLSSPFLRAPTLDLLFLPFGSDLRTFSCEGFESPQSFLSALLGCPRKLVKG